MVFPANVENPLLKITSYIKENLADFLHVIGEIVPLLTRQLAEDFGLAASTQLPLVHNGRSVGVVCFDSFRTRPVLEPACR